jgi:hypothetical protein
MDSNLEIVYDANFVKEYVKKDPTNVKFEKVNPADLMAEYNIKLTAVDKSDYEKEIADTAAAAQKAKADLKWTLAEQLYTRAHQLAVVYFGYESEQEGASKSEMENFKKLNEKHGSGLVKFVQNLLSQLQMSGSVYEAFLITDNEKPLIIANKQAIPTTYKREIDAVISSELSTRITKKKLFEEVPSNETNKQMPGAIIGGLIGILSNMIIQMTLYIYIVNQLRLKNMDDGVGSDNNELILLFNILAGLKLAEQKVIRLSAEQNKAPGEEDDFEETKVDSVFLNKLMASVLSAGSMLGVIGLVSIGGRKISRKKRRTKGVKSRRLNNKKEGRKGRTKRYLKKGKSTIKLRKHNRR